MTLAPEVRAGWRAWSRQFEGEVPYAYCDVRRLVTAIVGNLADPVRLMLEMPWRAPGGALATEAQVRAEFARVKAIGAAAGPRGLAYPYYHSPAGLFIDEAGIGEEVLRRYDANTAVLLRHRPAAASWPDNAIKAVMSMGWACGIESVLDPKKWPHFNAALDAERWDLAAAACSISELNNAGVHPRNVADRALLEHATAA